MDTYDDEIKIYEDVLSGERIKFPNGFFFDRNVTIKVMRYAVEKEYGKNLTRECILSLDSYFFVSRRLKYALQCNSPFAVLLSETFPEFNIEPFETKKVPITYWRSSKNRAHYVKWLFKKFNVNINDKDSVRKITADVVADNYGSRALKEADGLYELLNEVLFYRYEIWEIMDVPFWTEDLSIRAVIWLLEEKLGYTKKEIFRWRDDEITCMCTGDAIRSHNLEGLWKNVFFHSTVSMVRSVYTI